LIRRVRQLGHPLCAGLDPHVPSIPSLFRRGSMTLRDPATAEAVEAFLGALLDRLADRVAIVKPQIAFFEQLGWRGIRVLETVVASARARSLLVLLDAKRGDIGSTAAGYATYLDTQGPMPVDALTVNPYLGLDSLEPFVTMAARKGAGLFVLAKTSNPGARDFQERALDGRPLFEWVAQSLRASAERLTAGSSGWSSLGIVVGATYPEQHRRLRELLPRALFLVPGYGAQGGTARDAVAGFLPGPAGCLEGGIVNSSRALIFPDDGHTTDVRAWERAIDAACQRAIDELRAAIGRRA
jgi:orotidine-5'-phosphate decarboxylase